LDIEFRKEIPAFIIDNVFSDEINGAIRKEILDNENNFEPAIIGGGKCENHRSNDVWYVETDQQFPNRCASTIMSAMDRLYKSNACFALALVSSGIYPFTEIKETNYGETQVSVYNCGDFYNWHIDHLTEPNSKRLISTVYYAFDGDTVSGGELELSSSLMGQRTVIDDKAKTWKIEPKNNRMIVFTSYRPHRAAAVSIKGDEFKDKRFAVVSWIGIT